MSIVTDSFRELSDAYNGTDWTKNINQQLDVLSKTLRQYANSTSGETLSCVNLLAMIFAGYESDDTYFMDAVNNWYHEMGDSVDDFLLNGEDFSATATIPSGTIQYEVSLVSSTEVDATYDLIFNGTTVGNFILDKQTHQIVDVNMNKENIANVRVGDDLIVESITEISASLVTGIGTSLGLADVYDVAKKLNWDGDAEHSLPILRDVIGHTSTFSPDLKTNLLSSLSGGINGLMTSTLDLIRGTRDHMQAVERGDEEFGFSTSITVNEFSCGLILQTVASLIAAAGLIVSMLNPLVGAITSIIGAVAYGVIKIVSSVVQYAAGTKFTVSPGNTNQCFGFVVSRGTLRDNGVIQFEEALGIDLTDYPLFTIEFNELPTLLIGRRYVDEGGHDCLDFEEHLSINFDLTTNAIFSDTAGCASDETGAIIFHCPSNAGDSSGLGFSIDSKRDWDLATIRRKAFHPIKTTVIDSLKGVVIDQNPFWSSRLASAGLLWILSMLDPAINKMRFDMQDQDVIDAVGTYPMFCFPAAANQDTFYEALRDFATACGALLNRMLNQTDQQSVVIEFEDGFFDRLLTSVKATFDQLKYVDGSLLTSGPFRMVGFDRVTWTFNEQDVWDIDASSVWDECRRRIQSPIYRLQYETDSNLTHSIGAGYYMTCTVGLPTLTFSGFLLGLFFDALMIVAITAVAVGVSIGIKKLKAKRSVYAAKAENSWAQLVNISNDPNATKADIKAAYSAYKGNRLKHNILAALTGGSMLSLDFWGVNAASAPVLSNTPAINSTAEQVPEIITALNPQQSGSLASDLVSNINEVKVLICGETQNPVSEVESDTGVNR